MDELRLKLLESRFGFLSFGKVADETGEETPVGGFHFTDRQFHWEGRAISALTDHHAPDTDYASLAGAQVTLQISIVVLAIRRGHQDPDILLQCFLCRITEQSFSG